jgi:hypothetical protein
MMYFVLYCPERARYSIVHGRRKLGERDCEDCLPGSEQGEAVMDDSHEPAIIALLLVIAMCLTTFFLRVGEPTGALVEFLFPRM